MFLLGDSTVLFLSGLVSFLLGHVFYVLAFVQLADLDHIEDVIKSSPNFIYHIGFAVLFSLVVYFFWLSPNLKSLKLPVLCYVVVITLMVLTSLFVYHDKEVGKPKAQEMVLLGACLFFFSDLGVARQKFVQSSLWNRIICLPAYYLAQVILAYTLGKFH